MIKTWNERCQEHPAHASGMITHDMIQMRMQEEIDELRAALAQPEQEPLTDAEMHWCFTSTNTSEPLNEGWPGLKRFARAIEKAHGIGGEHE